MTCLYIPEHKFKTYNYIESVEIILWDNKKKIKTTMYSLIHLYIYIYITYIHTYMCITFTHTFIYSERKITTLKKTHQPSSNTPLAILFIRASNAETARQENDDDDANVNDKREWVRDIQRGKKKKRKRVNINRPNECERLRIYLLFPFTFFFLFFHPALISRLFLSRVARLLFRTHVPTATSPSNVDKYVYIFIHMCIWRIYRTIIFICIGIWARASLICNFNLPRDTQILKKKNPTGTVEQYKRVCWVGIVEILPRNGGEKENVERKESNCKREWKGIKVCMEK